MTVCLLRKIPSCTGRRPDRLLERTGKAWDLTCQYLINVSTVISMSVVIGMFLLFFESRYPKKIYLVSRIPFLTV